MTDISYPAKLCKLEEENQLLKSNLKFLPVQDLSIYVDTCSGYSFLISHDFDA